MNYDISKLNKEKLNFTYYDEPVTYDEKIVYNKSQWKVYLEKGKVIFKNIKTNTNYELKEIDTLLFLLQISDDEFLVLFYYIPSYFTDRRDDANFQFYRLCIKDNEIQYIFELKFKYTLINYKPIDDYDALYHNYNPKAAWKIPYFLLTSDILVFNCHSFETYMYSISKNAMIDNPDINHIITNNEIPESEFARYRLISPIYTEGSSFPTYIRIDYRRLCFYQTQYVQLLLEAPSLNPILLYDTNTALYYYFDPRYNHSNHVATCSLKEYFELQKEYLRHTELFLQNFYTDRRINDEQLLAIRPKDFLTESPDTI